MACDGKNTFATLAGLIHDVTDTECPTQNGSANDPVLFVCLFVSFFFLITFKRPFFY